MHNHDSILVTTLHYYEVATLLPKYDSAAALGHGTQDGYHSIDRAVYATFAI